MVETIAQIGKAIVDGKRFLVAAHENPDGDAIGSSLALGLALEEIGKQVTVYSRGPVPKAIDFLPGRDRIVSDLPDPGEYDTVFILDSGELNRIGGELEQLLVGHANIINIDHHRTNDEFGVINLVSEQASSTGELLWKIFRANDIPVGLGTATNLYTAIYTDTSGFRHSNAGPDSFHICAELRALGVDNVQVAEEYFFLQSEQRVRLLARALPTLQIDCDGKIAGISLTLADAEATGAGWDEVEGFVEFPRSIFGVQAAYFIREQKGGAVKGSLRSNGMVDVSAVAKEFPRGGGHARASGFRTEGTLDQVREFLVQRICTQLESNKD